MLWGSFAHTQLQNLLRMDLAENSRANTRFLFENSRKIGNIMITTLVGNKGDFGISLIDQ
ncbi:hypothetical protein KKIDH5335_05500 [Vibrio fluvialis]|nr:hypothetical protein KKIDH5335_05500 [Vibrio fluvialis]